MRDQKLEWDGPSRYKSDPEPQSAVPAAPRLNSKQQEKNLSPEQPQQSTQRISRSPQSPPAQEAASGSAGTPTAQPRQSTQRISRRPQTPPTELKPAGSAAAPAEQPRLSTVRISRRPPTPPPVEPPKQQQSTVRISRARQGLLPDAMPLPAKAEEEIEQAAAAVLRAWHKGCRRQRLELVSFRSSQMAIVQLDFAQALRLRMAVSCITSHARFMPLIQKCSTTSSVSLPACISLSVFVHVQVSHTNDSTTKRIFRTLYLGASFGVCFVLLWFLLCLLVLRLGCLVYGLGAGSQLARAEIFMGWALIAGGGGWHCRCCLHRGQEA